jgi:hypothetical protein
VSVVPARYIRNQTVQHSNSLIKAVQAVFFQSDSFFLIALNTMLKVRVTVSFCGSWLTNTKLSVNVAEWTV